MSKKKNNGDGMLVDTLFYRAAGISGDNTKAEIETQVQLRLVKEYDREYSGKNRPVSNLSFTLTCEDPQFKLVGTDVEVLRKAAWDYLDERFAVSWKEYYLVSLVKSYGARAGFTFDYDRIFMGVAHDGSILQRVFSHSMDTNWEVSVWPDEFRDRNGNLCSAIPATEENRLKLNEFEKLLVELKSKLNEFLSPEAILSTLDNLGAIGFSGQALLAEEKN
jgi:hypothetical protein